jgi:hypothetical protein
MSPAQDERDNISNVTPHAQFVRNAVYEYLPALSRGTSEPRPSARLEFTAVELVPSGAKDFEAALEDQATFQNETLWYRMVAGGSAPRYIRLRPRPSLSAILDARSSPPLPEAVKHLIARMTIEILNLRPNMSYGLRSPAHQ